MDNRDFLLAKCGNALAVAQLLQCTAQMAATAADGGLTQGLCQLSYAPLLAAGTLRPLALFPCDALRFVGVGPDAARPGAAAVETGPGGPRGVGAVVGATWCDDAGYRCCGG